MAPRSAGVAMIATRIVKPLPDAEVSRSPSSTCCAIEMLESAATNRFWYTSTSLPGSPSARAAGESAPSAQKASSASAIARTARRSFTTLLWGGPKTGCGEASRGKRRVSCRISAARGGRSSRQAAAAPFIHVRSVAVERVAPPGGYSRGLAEPEARSVQEISDQGRRVTYTWFDPPFRPEPPHSTLVYGMCFTEAGMIVLGAGEFEGRRYVNLL